MRVLLVEPYLNGSHRAWAEGYAARSGHEVRLLTHPGRWWKWRMRGSALTLARQLDDLGSWRPDLVLVTDMTDVAHFRTFAREILAAAPMVVYYHESQFTYPTAPRARDDLSFAMTNWLSAVAADHVLFNSGYHLEAFFDSLPGLLGSFPDFTHRPLIEEVRARSDVLPVGVDLSWARPERAPGSPPRIVWNHRWERDKDPDAFVDAIEKLITEGVDFELVLLGPRPPTDPPALDRIRRAAHDRIHHDGEATTDRYRELLTTSDVVVSTAIQEFFGVSIVEAVAAGCRPVLPARLSYPWLIPEPYHDSVLYTDDGLVKALAVAVAAPGAPPGLADTMRRFSWEHLVARYDETFQALAGR